MKTNENIKKTKPICLEKNISNIKSEFVINGIQIETDQRLLTKAEVKEYSRMHTDILEDPNVFKAVIEEQQLKTDDDIDKLSPETRFIIHNASQKASQQVNDIETKFIAFTLLNNMFYGGSLTVDGKIVEGIDKIIEVVDNFDPDIYDQLLFQAKSMQYPTPEETEEAKSSQVEER